MPDARLLATGMARSPDAARDELLDAAERRFAEHGVRGASLREIAAAAGHRNHSAAQYHFGDRAGLVVAIVQRRMAPVNQRRTALLAELDRAGRGGDIRSIVEVIVRPAVDIICAQPGWYARFLVRTRSDVLAVEILDGLPELGAIRALNARLKAALSELPPSIRRNRIEQLHSLTIATLADWEWARERGRRPLSVEALGDDLVQTGTALLTAPHVRR